MANLIIKPTSGGSLILQDEGGDAALTVGTTGNTTLAGNLAVTGSFPAGHIIQVLQDQKTDTSIYSSPTDTWTNIDGLSQVITLNNSANKVMIMHEGNYSMDDTYHHFLRFARGGTAIGIGDASSSRLQAAVKLDWGDDASGDMNNTRAVSFSWLDTPGSVGAHTYTVQFFRNAGTLLVNRSHVDTNTTSYGRVISTLTLWEIVG